MFSGRLTRWVHLSIWHWLILLAVVALGCSCGRGRISNIMGDLAHGIRSFREGLKDPNAPPENRPDSRPQIITDENRETVEPRKEKTG